jgi:hypothetical protein
MSYFRYACGKRESWRRFSSSPKKGMIHIGGIHPVTNMIRFWRGVGEVV